MVLTFFIFIPYRLMKLVDSKLNEVKELVERVLPREDLFLVDIDIKGGQRSPALWIYVESDLGGISLNDCSELSNNLHTILEAHELFNGPFTLNVSSPGLDKPLKLPRQYKLNEGRLARIRVRNNDEEHAGEIIELNGVLTSADDAGVELTPRSQPKKKGQKPKLRPEKARRVSYNHIIETKILPDM